MKKKIYILIIGIITVACIIIGTVININRVKGFYNNDESLGGNSEVISIPNCNSIKIDGKIMSVVIQSGNEASYEVRYNKRGLKPEMSVNGSEVVIKQSNFRKFFGHSVCELVMTIPQDMDLRELDIELNVGEIVIEDISVRKLDIENNVGEITVSNVDFMEFDGESNVGEIKLIGLSNPDDYSMELESNVGEIDVYGNEFRRSYNHAGGVINKKINLETNVGEIKIK